MTAFFWALFAYSGWLAVLAATVPALRKRPIAIAGIVLIVGWPLAWVTRGILADPCYVTGLLGWMLAWHRIKIPTAPQPRPISIMPALFVVGIAGALYASAVGPMPFDLYYSVGHRQAWAIPLLFTPAAWLDFRAGGAFGKIFPAVALLSISGIHESANAWDWFLDPFLALFALLKMTEVAVGNVRKRKEIRSA